MAAGRGGANKSAKLTPEEVLQIRRLARVERKTYGELCRVYGVSENTIARIVNFKAWGWLREDGSGAQPGVPINYDALLGEPSEAEKAEAAESFKRLTERLRADGIEPIKADEPAQPSEGDKPA